MSFPATTTEGPLNTQNWAALSSFLIIGVGDPEGAVKGRLGAVFLRTDGEAGATLYVKESGDGADEGWTFLQGGTRDYGIVEALPTSPIPAKGDLARYRAAAGYYWDLLYTGEETYPWAKIGGPPLVAQVLTAEKTASTTYANLATVGPNLTLPLAGDYLISHGVRVIDGTNFALMSVAIGATATSAGAQGAEDTSSSGRLGAGANTGVGGCAPPFPRTGLTKSHLVCAKYRVVGGEAEFESRRLVVDPIRVG